MCVSVCVCVCVCVCVVLCVCCVYVFLLGDTCNIDGFYFRTMECSKNALFTDTPMNAHSIYIPCKGNVLLSAVRPSSGVFQHANSIS